MHAVYIQPTEYRIHICKNGGYGGAKTCGFAIGIQSKMKSFIYSNYARANIDSKNNGHIEPHAHTHTQPTTAAAQFAFNNCENTTEFQSLKLLFVN